MKKAIAAPAFTNVTITNEPRPETRHKIRNQEQESGKNYERTLRNEIAGERPSSKVALLFTVLPSWNRDELVFVTTAG